MPTRLPVLRHRRFRRRRGVEVLQLVLVMPVLVLAVVAALQFSTVLVVNSTLSAAAVEAARLAAMGCDSADIDAGVTQFLDVHGVALGPGARLVILDETGIIQSSGDAGLTSPLLATLPPADMVRSVLIVSTDETPIPNALEDYCLDYSGRQYELCAAAVKFCDECET